jgi:hypothetical protein
MLPQKEQDFACEMLRKIVLAWDPDFTRLTPEETRRLKTGRQQLAAGNYLRDHEVDWDNLDQLDLS